MTAPTGVCTSCQTPLPLDAQFCPRCGTRTPTQISGGGTTTAVETGPDLSAERQREIQAALGPDYVVERRIGSGGFAEVWAATDTKLQRRVAVKVLHPELVASRALIERFQREAQAVAKLRHPGVIPIYAVGEHEGLVYYVMPLVEGESLRERLSREGALPADEVRRILKETAAALAVAHKAGIVHRDIKPENLMLEGEERRVLVMDFGIAKSTAGTQTGLTGTGMIIGTPAYMSPEQATGSKEIDARSDVYSLGVVGFELLTGRQPFKADSIPELIVQHVTAPAPSVNTVRTDTPEDLAIAVNRCLLKEPGERWKDAGELSVFLERVATPASRPGVPKELLKYARRRWRPSRKETLWVALGAVVALWAVQVAPADVSDAIRYWADKVGLSRSSPPPPLALPAADPGQAIAVSRRDAWLPLRTSVLADSMMAVWRPYGDVVWMFNGADWRSIPAPRSVSVAAIEAARGAVLLFEGVGKCPGCASARLFTLSGRRFREAGSLPFEVTATWTDGRDVLIGGAEGQLAWWEGRSWRRDPTPQNGMIAFLSGVSRHRIVALTGGFESAASTRDFPWFVSRRGALEYNGFAWTPPAWQNELSMSEAMQILADGAMLLVDPSALTTVDSSGRRTTVRLPPSFQSAPHEGRVTQFEVEGVRRLAADRTLIWGHSSNSRSPCDLLTSCLFVAHGDSVSAVHELAGVPVAGVVTLRGRTLVVQMDGTVWESRSGAWGLVTRVPGVDLRDNASAIAYDSSTTVRTGVTVQLGDQFRSVRWWSGIGRLEGSGVGSIALPSGVGGERIAWAGSTEFVLESGSSWFWLRCPPPMVECRATPIMLRSHASVTSVARLASGVVVGVGSPGMVAVFANGVWRPRALGAALSADTLLDVRATASGGVAVSRSRLVLIDPHGNVLRSVPLPATASEVKLVAPVGDSAVALASGKEVWIWPFAAGGLSMQTTSLSLGSEEVISDVASLPGNAVAVAEADTSGNPLATGSLEILQWSGHVSPGWAFGRQLPLPRGVSVRRLHVDSIFLRGLGTGGYEGWWRLPSHPRHPATTPTLP